MATFNDSFDALAAVSLWYKQRDGDSFVLSDIPKLLPLRWPDFRDNWEFIKEDLEGRISESFNPDLLVANMADMSDFVVSQRESKVNPFNNANILFKFYTIFDLIDITTIQLSKEETRIIREEIEKVTNYTRHDFEDARDILILERDALADNKGLTDADYNRVYSRSPGPAQSTARVSDIQNLQQLQDGIKTIDFILANAFSIKATPLDPFQLARDNANNEDIDISQYASGYLVRFEYGDTLQKLADRFLGDPDKWIDIALANGLKPPYVDEVGKKINLLSNGDGNQINVAGVDGLGEPNKDKFYVGQTILLQSNVEKYPERRIILNIEEVPVSGELVFELDGESDLNKYKIADNAHVRVFKPNTVNSNFFILIPSEEPLEGYQKEVPYFLDSAADDEKRQGVDLALNDSADLTFTSTDDLQLSFGLANSIQAVKLKVLIEEGELTRHREFGLRNVTGATNANIDDIKEILINSMTDQIAADDRFDRIERITVDELVNVTNTRAASGLAMTLSVRLAGSGRVIPITFSVTTS